MLDLSHLLQLLQTKFGHFLQQMEQVDKPYLQMDQAHFLGQLQPLEQHLANLC
jgi:hypothetical protein